MKKSLFTIQRLMIAFGLVITGQVQSRCVEQQRSTKGYTANAAGTGARIALLDERSRSIIEDVVRRVEKIETAIEPRFQAHFVEAMAIPHKRFANPELGKVVTLPPPKESAAQASASRGRRSRRPG